MNITRTNQLTTQSNVKLPSATDQLSGQRSKFAFNQPIIFTFYFRLIYHLIGVNFAGRSKWSRVAISFVVMKLGINLIFEIKSSFVNHYSFMIFVAVMSLSGIPLIEFYLLHRICYREKMCKLIFIFQDEIFNSPSNLMIIKSIVRMSILLSFVIVFQWMNVYSFVFFAVEDESKSAWFFDRTLPLTSHFNYHLRCVLLCIVYLFESLITSYISLSVALYICLFRSFMSYKQCVLERMRQIELTNNIFGVNLNEISEVIDLYESIVAVSPFNWLVYCMASGSCFLLNLLVQPYEAILGGSFGLYLTVAFCLSSFIIVFVALCYITCLEEHFVHLVELSVREMQVQVATAGHLLLLERMKLVLTKPVTVGSICCIKRSLIVTYIGSCITFSTLFMQFQVLASQVKKM